MTVASIEAEIAAHDAGMRDKLDLQPGDDWRYYASETRYSADIRHGERLAGRLEAAQTAAHVVSASERGT